MTKANRMKQTSCKAYPCFSEARRPTYPYLNSIGLLGAFAARIVQNDAKLRRRFAIAGDIADSGEGSRNLEIGDWIWWPHADGHVAVVVEVESSHIEAAYEPRSTKKLAPSYVVKLNVS